MDRGWREQAGIWGGPRPGGIPARYRRIWTTELGWSPAGGLGGGTRGAVEGLVPFDGEAAEFLGVVDLELLF